MTNPTPGPWGQGNYWWCIEGPTDEPICQMERLADALEEAEANARLIAAAPALLVACEEALRLCESNGYGRSSTQDVLRAAIAQARNGDCAAPEEKP